MSDSVCKKEVTHLSLDTNYAYAIGRIRVIEKRLLDKSKFDRMIDSKSPVEALKVLLEAGYGETTAEVTTETMSKTFEYERLLKEEQKRLYGLLREITDESQIFDLFLLKNDYHNIKVILKSEFLGQEDIGNLMDSGTLPISYIKTAIRERNFEEFALTMKEAIEECLDTFNRTNDPQQIDLILDRASFRHMSELADTIEHYFINDILNIIIDMTNINIFLRLKDLDMPVEFLKKSLISGGIINNEIFIENMDSTYEDFLQSMKNSPYENICRAGIGDLIDKGSLAKFEKLADNYIIDFVKKVKYKTLGIEPLIGYLIAKENELKNVRIVMVGKINNITPDIIRERMRESYV